MNGHCLFLQSRFRAWFYTHTDKNHVRVAKRDNVGFRLCAYGAHAGLAANGCMDAVEPARMALSLKYARTHQRTSRMTAWSFRYLSSAAYFSARKTPINRIARPARRIWCLQYFWCFLLRQCTAYCFMPLTHISHLQQRMPCGGNCCGRSASGAGGQEPTSRLSATSDELGPDIAHVQISQGGKTAMRWHKRGNRLGRVICIRTLGY